MTKDRRIEIRLDDDQFRKLSLIRKYHETGITGAISILLETCVPTRICGERVVYYGRRRRTRFNVCFSNGLVVHGFLWSRGGQLLGPRVWDQGREIRIVDGSDAFWNRLRKYCKDYFESNAARDVEEVERTDQREAPRLEGN